MTRRALWLLTLLALATALAAEPERAELAQSPSSGPFVGFSKESQRKGPLAPLRRLDRNLKTLRLKLAVWLRLLLEFPGVVKVFKQHKQDGFFDYGEPGRFSKLEQHPAWSTLVENRRGGGDGTPGFRSTVRFVDDGSVLPTYLPVEHGAGAALGALGLAAADLFELRTGVAQEVEVRRSDAGLATASYMFLKVAPEGNYAGCDGFGATIDQEGKVNPVRKAYTCRDGSAVFLHGGFPKLKKGILKFFGDVPATVDAIAPQAAQWDGPALEAAMQAEGLAVTLCRTPKEWRAHPQGQHVLNSPLIDLTVRQPAPTDAATPAPTLARALPTGPGVTRPLSDCLVVDFSHVIASPVAGRSLVDFGATVIKIVTHKRPRRHLFDEEANSGKATMELDLDTMEGKARLWELLQAADVLIDGYTDGVLAKQGFPIDDVLKKCPHLVYLQVSCYGFGGPFAGRKGFQQNANFCAGVAGLEDEELLGYQLVSQIDYATGFLGAFGVVLALTERQQAAARGEAVEGVHVRVSLCHTATWMAGFGALRPRFLSYVRSITRLIFGCGGRAVTAGNMAYLPPAVRMAATPPTRVNGFNRWWRSGEKHTL